MRYDRNILLSNLQALAIEYELYEHPAVFTTKDVSLLPHPIPGQDTKNLFLRDEKHQTFILVCVRAETRVNLKELGRSLCIKGITFGSPDELQSLLGVTPGSVCLFALGNDSERKVTGYIDAAIDPDGRIQNHPLENTATVVLGVRDMERVIELIHGPLNRVTIPQRSGE